MNETLWSRQVPPRAPSTASVPRAPSTASDVWRDDVLSPAGITFSRSLLRRHVKATSLPPGVGDDDVDVLLLAYEELASNAIRHGRLPVHVTVTAMDDGWLIDVVDGAPGCAPIPSVGRDPAHGGLGLHLVARLCTAHGWWTEANCKHVWARVRPATAAHVPASKLVVPELPAEFAPRPRLRQLLDEASTDQIIVVSAPGGSGKTLLVADWVRSGEGPETAWISLGRDENDPRRLWAAVVTALLAVPSVAADHRLQRLLSDVTRQRNADVVDALAAAFDVLDPPVRLVLDDVHELIGTQVLRDLARLVRHRPAGLRLVLASRMDPPISVSRLRLEGRLHELRVNVLRFTLDDTAALLHAAGLQLTPALLAVLHTRTDGWVAGLRLAALALGRTDDPDGFLTAFSGDECSVAEYLTGEILAGLTPDTRDLLQTVSLCSPVPGALATQLSGRPHAEALLDRLGKETALVQRTTPGTYRIQPLLRSHLSADLARHRPETYRDLESTAARWWLAAEQPVHALRHAERAGDSALIADLVHRS